MVYNRILVALGPFTKVTGPTVSYQYDQKQILVISGVALPEYYEVDICNEGDTTTVTMVGTADGVLIPNAFLRTGRKVKAYVVLQGQDPGAVETRYEITLPVYVRPAREDIDPTAAEQQQIDALVATLNDGVSRAETAASEAEESAGSASADADRAETAATRAEEAVEDVSAYAIRAETAAGHAESSAQDAAESAGIATDKAEEAAGHAESSAESAAASREYAESADHSADDAAELARAADTSASASAASAGQAASSAQSASGSASQAANSASAARQSETNAAAKAQEAASKATEAGNAKDAAVTAKNDAVTAKNAAETAQGKAEDAQAAAEAAAQSAEESAAQISIFEPIPGTVETVNFDSAGNPASIVHTDGTDVVRTDAFVWGDDNTVTETRTLADGRYIVMVTDLTTLVTTISEIQEGT